MLALVASCSEPAQTIWLKTSSNVRFPVQCPLCALQEVPGKILIVALHLCPMLIASYCSQSIHDWTFTALCELSNLMCSSQCVVSCHLPPNTTNGIAIYMIVWIWNQLDSRLHRMMWNRLADLDEISTVCSVAAHDHRFTLMHQLVNYSKSPDHLISILWPLHRAWLKWQYCYLLVWISTDFVFVVYPIQSLFNW